MTQMLKPLAAATMIAALTGGAPLMADDGPVVVELFTSQGCSSCPPADAMLHDLARQSDVIALALHVDYWDYLGWRDDFASPAHTARQRAYARAAGSRNIYTPQFIIAGQDVVVGAKPMEVMAGIRDHDALDTGVDVTAVRTAGGVRIEATAPARGDMVVQLVRYLPEQSVDVLRGENAGQRLVYSNIVTSWEQVATWNGAAPLALEATLDGNQPGVVIVQEAGMGAILAAVRLP